MMMATNTETAKLMRVAHHIGRARLLIDLLRQQLEAQDSDGNFATSLLVVSNELEAAASVLRDQASPKNWQPRGPLIEFGA
jgi:hypothetical protein